MPMKISKDEDLIQEASGFHEIMGSTSNSAGEKLLLEVFVRGAWWDVQQLRIEGGELVAHFENQRREFDEVVSIDHVRPRSRKADENDCLKFLKAGMDVCVFALHPKGKTRHSGFSPFRAWYDARLIAIDRKPHQQGCDCKFYVRFYRANMEDVLNIEHRPLVTSRKRKIGIESIAILQAPYALKEQPTVIRKPIDMCRDSSSLCIPTVASKSIKLQIEKLISLSVEQGHAAEISLRLSTGGDLPTDMIEDDTLSLKDESVHGNFLQLKFKDKKDVGCFMIKEQEDMSIICSNKDIRCFILSIDKWDSCQARLQVDDQQCSAKFIGNLDYSDGYYSSWIHNGLSMRHPLSQNAIITMRRSEQLEKQNNEIVTQTQKCKSARKHTSRNGELTRDFEKHRHQENMIDLTVRCSSDISRKKQKIIATSSQSQYLQGYAREVEYKREKKRLALFTQCTSKRRREPNYDVSTLRRSKRLREQAKQIQNKLLQLMKEKKPLKPGKKRKKTQAVSNYPPLPNIEYTNINGNMNLSTSLINVEDVDIPMQKWIEKIPTNISDIDMYTEIHDSENSGICMTLGHVASLSDKCETEEAENKDLVIFEKESLTAIETFDINVSEEDVDSRNAMISLQIEDGFRREMSNSEYIEGIHSQSQICEVDGEIADINQCRMSIGNTIPAISLESDNSHTETKCLDNMNDGRNHAGESSKKLMSPHHNETSFNEDLLHRIDESDNNIPTYLKEQCKRVLLEEVNSTTSQIGEYEPAKKHDAGNQMLTVVGNNSIWNQNCNLVSMFQEVSGMGTVQDAGTHFPDGGMGLQDSGVRFQDVGTHHWDGLQIPGHIPAEHSIVCTEEANMGNHMEKTDAKTSHITGSMLICRDTDSLHSDNSNREVKCVRNLKDKPKLKQEARNKQRLLSVGQKETSNENRPNLEARLKKETSDLKDISKAKKQDSQKLHLTSQSEMLALSNKCLEEDKQSKACSENNVAGQTEENERMENHHTEIQWVEDSDSPSCDSIDSAEINTRILMEEVSSNIPCASASKVKVCKTRPVISVNSNSSKTQFEHQKYPKDRTKNPEEVLPEQRTAFLKKKENNVCVGPERGNIHRAPISTANVVSTSKGLLEKNLQTRFQHLSACIETEIHRPSPPLLPRWAMIEKIFDANENLISDLIINEDVLDLNGTLKEESSDLKNLWEEMEQNSHGTLLALESMFPTDRAGPCYSSEEESEDDVYGNFCRNGHKFILDEEIGIICQVCNFVKTEIKNVLAPFQVWNSERSQRPLRDEFYMNKNFGNIVIPPLDEDLLCCQSYDFPEKHDSVWKIIPELEKKMNVHQKRAFEFLWRNIAGSLVPEEMKDASNDVGGCIIAHAPGTGKSFTIISFLQSYMTLFPRCKPLIIAPKSMLHTWAREFQKWNVNIPVYIINSLKDFKIRENPVRLTKMLKACKTTSLRQIYNVNCIAMIHEWHKKESVLVLSYPLFFTLTNEENPFQSEETRLIGNYLTRSPGLLILDEGHIPRSHRSKIWNLLMKVNTKLRILLSGTLFQNNFEEYFNTLCLARPSFVDRILQLKKHKTRGLDEEKKEKIARRYFVDEIARNINTKRSIERGACRQLLKSMTEDFIDVYKGEVLNSLPGLRIYNVMLHPAPLQEKLLKEIVETITSKGGSSLELEVITSVLSIHPSLFKDVVFTDKYFDDLNLDIFRKDPNQGVKLKFVVQIVKLCSIKREKVLIFCQYIPPLLLLEEIFESLFNWSRGQEILLLEGKHQVDERQVTIDKFSQQEGKARILLASIKACGVGVNLTEASRVILLDPVWNPSCSKQAICRAFRMGQKRFVHVYQLVTFGTLEEEKYEKSVWKERMSNLIYSSDGSQHVEALRIEDDVLRQLVEGNSTMFQRITEQEDNQKHKGKDKDSSIDMDIDFDDILELD